MRTLDNMYILAIDTSNNICTVTLINDTDILCELVENTPSKQSEMLMSMIEKIMDTSNISYENISLFATSIGPGSFTGVRIGISAVKGIELVTQKQIVGISNLEAIAWKSYKRTGETKIISCINAMRNQVFVQKFKIESNIPKAINKPELIFIDDIESYLDEGNKRYIATNCNELIIQKIRNNTKISQNIITNSQDIALLAHYMYKQNITTKVSPLYIRPPDAKKPS